MQPSVAGFLFSGETLSLRPLEEGLVELRFERREGAVNMFDLCTVAELDAASARLAQFAGLRGILITSGKDVFIVGADITEFTVTFALPRSQLLDYLRRSNAVFLRFEALDVPSVAAINGYALGGGLEFALVASHRVMAEGARVGLPEVGLGLIPGFGGTVRLPRVAGVAHALDWITDGEPRGPADALRCGVVDRVCAPADLRAQALQLLRSAAPDWQARREARRQPCRADGELAQLLAERRTRCARKVPAYLPAAHAAIELLARAVLLPAPAAQEAEGETFATLAQSQAAAALVRNFVNQLAVRRLARQMTSAAMEGGSGTAATSFASPSPGASLVEIDAGPDAGAVASAAAEAAAAGKTSLQIRGPCGPGGLVRRLHAACMRVCVALRARGVPVDVIDAAACAAGWALGPFAVDRVLGASNAPAPSAAQGNAMATADIVDRLLIALIVESARLLDEGVVGSPAEIDIGAQLGLGFPRHFGGPLHHADWLGLPEVCARAARSGESVPAALQARAARGQGFYAA